MNSAPIVIGSITTLAALVAIIAVVLAVVDSPQSDDNTNAAATSKLADPPTAEPDSPAAPMDQATTTTAPAPRFQVSDCVGGNLPDSPVSGSCSDGTSPYRVTEVVSANSGRPSCGSYLAASSYFYCLKPNFNVNHCYRTLPRDGSYWISVPRSCAEPGTMTVLQVSPGISDGDVCRGRKYNRWYSFSDPALTICVYTY